MRITSKRFLTRGFLLILGGVLGCLTGTLRAQQAPPDYSKVSEQTVPVTNNIFVLHAVGQNMGNIGVLVGSDGILMVDTQVAPMHDKIMDALGKISTQPVRYVINTHFHGDHTGGNEAMGKLGAVIIGHDTIRTRLLGGMPPNDAPAPKEALPSITYSDSMTLTFNGEVIYIFHPVQAHTDGDSVIYFRHANVMHIGDLSFYQGFSPVNLPGGFRINGFITAMEEIMKVGNPDTKIITGHRGPVITMKDLQQQHDMTIAIRDRILAGIRDGKSEAEIVASKPTADFPNETGGTAPDAFVKGVYQDLVRAQ